MVSITRKTCVIKSKEHSGVQVSYIMLIAYPPMFTAQQPLNHILLAGDREETTQARTAIGAKTPGIRDYLYTIKKQTMTHINNETEKAMIAVMSNAAKATGDFFKFLIVRFHWKPIYINGKLFDVSIFTL